MELKVLDPIKNPSREFKSIEEFDAFFQKNKEDLNSKTTQQLNKLYRITDNGEEYKITKKGTRDSSGQRVIGEICVKKRCNKNDDSDLRIEMISLIGELNAKIESLEKENSILKRDFKELNNHFNQTIEIINKRFSE